MTGKRSRPKTLEEIEQHIDEEELFLGLEADRLTPAAKAKTIEEDRARRAFDQTEEARRYQALEDQRIEVLAEMDLLQSSNAIDKHRRIAKLQQQLQHIEQSIQQLGDVRALGVDASSRRERLRARHRSLKADGVRAHLKVLAKEEGVTVSRIKQLLNPQKRKGQSSG